MNIEEVQKRLDEISETIKELRAYGSDEARAKRAIAHEKFILDGVSRKRDPVPWAIAQFRLASSLAVIAGKARDIPGLRKAAYRLEKARRIFQHAGYEEASQKCEVMLAEIKKLLGKFGNKGDLFNLGRNIGGGDDGLESESRVYADDLVDRLRQATGRIDRDTATRCAQALREARELEEMAVRDAMKEREQARQFRDRSGQRGHGRGRDR